MTILSPKHTIIERTAGEIAGTFYEAGRNTGLKSKYKNARLYAKGEFTKFIPKACEILTEMLGRNDIHENLKREIYDALLERANDPDLAVFDAPMLPNGVARVQKNILEDFRNNFDREFGQ